MIAAGVGLAVTIPSLRLNVSITGRGARQALRDVADTVSDIGMEKHAFQSGIKAMPGLEF